MARKRDPRPSERQRRERKQRVLVQRTPSIVRSIADAIVVKDQSLYFLSAPDGNVPLSDEHGYGLYYHDCRFLDGYELKLEGQHASVLASSASEGYQAVFQLSNPDLQGESARLIPKEDLGVQWLRLVSGADRALHDRLTLHNFGPEPYDFSFSLTFRASFEDIFEVRGLVPEQVGRLLDPVWQDGALCLGYAGADGLYRYVTIHFSPAPTRCEGTSAVFRLGLAPETQAEVQVTVALTEARAPVAPVPRPLVPPDFALIHGRLGEAAAAWYQHHANIRSDSLLLDRIMAQSLRDLHTLGSKLEHEAYLSAGVPWYTTLFGRDSLIASLEALAYNPDIAEQTLRLLARHQGRREDAWRDEQPGKILHELRVGELARLKEIPYDPYYGSIDSTPLFLILLGQHAAWTGDLSLFVALKPNVERALSWMADYGDPLGAGCLSYRCASAKGLANQGWKDSGLAIMNADGSPATPPIALVEVQGYVYLAKTLIADLFRRSGDAERAERLIAEAEALRRWFNRAFWDEAMGCYVLALQEGFRPAAVVASNAGQALWSGIADPEKAARVAKRLLAPDMYSGWGIRTLSTLERRFNPIGYHLGTVWPHDNALIAAGFKRYGLDQAAYRVFNGLFEAATHFQHYRVPELFAGYPSVPFAEPIRYPVACHPQAWAAAAIPYLLQTLLGLVPEAFERRLRIVRPVLPDFLQVLELHRLRVANARVDLRFERDRSGVSVRTLKLDGPLEILVQH
ncbi:MAG TPA: glycogen debranching N-terminal domain-containing protein [Pantanalinema sp.]